LNPATPRSGAMTLGRSFLVWLLGVLVVTLVLVSALVLRHEQRILEGELRVRAGLLAEIAGRTALAGGGPDDLAILAEADLRAAEVRSASGQVLWRFGPPPVEVALLDPDALRVERRVDAGAALEGGQQRLEVVVLVSRARIRAHLAAAAVRLLAGLGIALALALVVAMVLVGKVVRPLQELAAWARGFDPDLPLEAPLEGPAPAEVGDLARAFRDMAGRLVEQRQSLVASERRFRELFAASPSPLIRLDTELAIRDANPASEPFLPGGAARAVGRRLEAYLEPPPAALGRALAGAAGGAETAVETNWRMDDGTLAEVELRIAAMGADGRHGVLVAIHDLTDRVRRMGERWRRTFDAMVDGVALVDPEGRITLANRALAPHEGAVAAMLALAVRGAAPARWRAENVGRLLECSLSFPEGLGHAILVVRDVTESVDAEARLRAADKMQAVGTLAAGVAHDFNNLLAAVLLHARLLEREPEAAPATAAAIAALAQEGTEVVSELLYYARPDHAPPTTFDLVELVRLQDGVLRHLLPASVALELELDDEPVPVEGDALGLRRLLLNLVLNARDAVSERGGRVTVRVEHAAGRAVLEVADDGPGIPPEVRKRLFEPFFTLRRHGRGSGLGLAVVYSIAVAHDGEVDVRSRKDEGTRFIVRLPLADARRLEAVEAAAGPPGTPCGCCLSSPTAARRRAPSRRSPGPAPSCGTRRASRPPRCSPPAGARRQCSSPPAPPPKTRPRPPEPAHDPPRRPRNRRHRRLGPAGDTAAIGCRPRDDPRSPA
jgi:PAS domain S-box-containing protein